MERIMKNLKNWSVALAVMCVFIVVQPLRDTYMDSQGPYELAGIHGEAI